MGNLIYNKYMNLILKTTPSKSWVVLRSILHWVSMPFKLLVIGFLGLFQIARKTVNTKTRNAPRLPELATKKAYFKKIYERLPVWEAVGFTTYAPRVPYYNIPNGSNHITDHQCSRHGTYTFLLQKLGSDAPGAISGVRMMMQGKWLLRGYGLLPVEQEMFYNAGTTSGDMLIGLSLAMLTMNRNSPAAEITFEKFDELIHNILTNDFALLEGASPAKGDPGYDMWQEQCQRFGQRNELVQMKSSRGMWQPGLETVGAQALTILAALRVAQKRNGNRDAGEAYNKLLKHYGYGILSLFPTAYIDSKRGYFNDHNCMVALYILSKLSDSRAGRLFWKIPMVYVWSLSRHWYNGYFTGLLNDAHPGTVSQAYVDKCLGFLYQNEPNEYHFSGNVVKGDAPVTYNSLNSDEFTPDVPQDEMYDMQGATQFKSGLGFIAAAVMLEKDPKSLL